MFLRKALNRLIFALAYLREAGKTDTAQRRVETAIKSVTATMRQR